MKPAPQERLYTEAEYFELAEKSLERLEYLDGRVYAMSGALPEHEAIVANLTLALGARLRGTTCRPYGGNLRLYSPRTGLYTYADLSVVCGGPTRHPNDPMSILNPVILFEVLSPSTEAYDRGEKFAHYQGIDGLREYVLVSQKRPQIDHHARRENGQWLLTPVSGLDATLDLPVLGIQIPASEIYLDVEFPPAPPSRLSE
jgi:Uma2 family endonuclease